jgi:hypothetical protein
VAPAPAPAPDEPPPAAPVANRPAPEVAPEAASEPDVGALFEKLRSERPESASGESGDHGGSGAGSEQAAAEAPSSDASPPDGPSTAPPSDAASSAPEPSEADDDHARADQEARETREAALADATEDLQRRGKRALQDEQNDVLDGLRRQRGKIDTAAVLPPLAEQLARWAHVLQPAVDAAYSSGAASAGGTLKAAPRALLTELSTAAVTPLRDRLASSLESIDSPSPAEVEIAVAQRLGARYREWRGQELAAVLGDVIAVAYSRGGYDAAPDGARLRWIPAHEGKCPDCDDNALEPTAKGSEFPTGQPYPPAHPGCRCLLVIDTEG